MSLGDAVTYAGAALLIAAVIYVPRRISSRQRLRFGSFLFVIGWAGVILTLRLSHLPFLQSEVVAFTLMGAFALAIVVSALFLVTAFFDWLRKPRRNRR